MDKVVFASAVTTAGGCTYVNGCTVNEMLMVVICILGLCLTWQVSVVIHQCRQRRKRIHALMRVRRCEDGKPC